MSPTNPDAAQPRLFQADRRKLTTAQLRLALASLDLQPATIQPAALSHIFLPLRCRPVVSAVMPRTASPTGDRTPSPPRADAQVAQPSIENMASLSWQELMALEPPSSNIPFQRTIVYGELPFYFPSEGPSRQDDLGRQPSWPVGGLAHRRLSTTARPTRSLASPPPSIPLPRTPPRVIDVNQSWTSAQIQETVRQMVAGEAVLPQTQPAVVPGATDGSVNSQHPLAPVSQAHGDADVFAQTEDASVAGTPYHLQATTAEAPSQDAKVPSRLMSRGSVRRMFGVHRFPHLQLPRSGSKASNQSRSMDRGYLKRLKKFHAAGIVIPTTDSELFLTDPPSDHGGRQRLTRLGLGLYHSLTRRSRLLMSPSIGAEDEVQMLAAHSPALGVLAAPRRKSTGWVDQATPSKPPTMTSVTRSKSVRATEAKRTPAELARDAPTPSRSKSVRRTMLDLFSPDGLTRRPFAQELGAQEVLQLRVGKEVVLVFERVSGAIQPTAGTLRAIVGELLGPVFPKGLAPQKKYTSLVLRSLPLLAPDFDLLKFLAERFTEAHGLKCGRMQVKILLLLETWAEIKEDECVKWDPEMLDVFLRGNVIDDGLVHVTAQTLARRISTLQKERRDRLKETEFMDYMEYMYGGTPEYPETAEGTLMTEVQAVTLNRRSEYRDAIKALKPAPSRQSAVMILDHALLAQYLAAVDLIFFREAVDPTGLETRLKHHPFTGSVSVITPELLRACRLDKRSKMIRQWVLFSILNTDRPTKRAQMVTKFVKVAELLVFYGDLHGADVIVRAIEEKFSRDAFKVSWRDLDKEGISGLLENLSYMLGARYEDTLENLLDPVIPIFAGRTGLRQEITKEYTRNVHLVRESYNALDGKTTRNVDASLAIPYAHDAVTLLRGAVLDLAKFKKLWDLVDAARDRVVETHLFGTVSKNSFLTELYDPGCSAWGPRDQLSLASASPFVNDKLDNISVDVERSIMRAWMAKVPSSDEIVHDHREEDLYDGDDEFGERLMRRKGKEARDRKGTNDEEARKRTVDEATADDRMAKSEGDGSESERMRSKVFAILYSRAERNEANWL
ncbi:MAG: hypothetical protein M1838_005564 [Thelocarpon superellum]|nr:MAG: hypothetical protein M1838_005564 [Thelocarpon superellum]